MKKFATVSALFILSIFFLLSCGQEKTYDDGFEDGYDMGYFDASVNFENDYARGYEEGLRDGHHDAEEYFPEIIHDAEHYAAITGGWHPEEAWGIVEAYLTNMPMDDDGIPSYDEYLAAVDSLICFYEYFYGRHY